MSETSSPRRVLHLVVQGLAADRLAELTAHGSLAPEIHDLIEIFPLSEANAPEALEKIFAADTVTVWGDLV